jgi:flavin-dependent dehydrogenase
LKKVVIIGGGLAGLISSIQLQHAGLECTLFEKKSYPFHRVCGEYISNEAVPFLRSLNLYPEEFSPPQISRFQLSAVSGKSSVLPLDMGGFGISRYVFDEFLSVHARKVGVNVYSNLEVENVTYSGEKFIIQTQVNQTTADIVIGSFGKRSKMDVTLKREFVRQRSPFVGVKYHLRTGHPSDLIALHNFEGGYCGMSNIEGGKTNLCYLVHRDIIRQAGTIERMQERVMFRNPLLKRIFEDAEFLFDKPEVINEISFKTKSAVEDHMLMIGDAAGMITPLCGNGMAMAIHSAKIASELVIDFAKGVIGRGEMEKRYEAIWKKSFSGRLREGRVIQRLFGSHAASNIAILLALGVPPLAKAIIRRTHGDYF